MEQQNKTTNTSNIPVVGGFNITNTPIEGNFDQNSVSDFVTKYGGTWNPETGAALFEGLRLGSKAQYTGAGANNAAMNSAILAKLKGYNSPSSSGIGGSSSVSMDKMKNDAMTSAGESLAKGQVGSPLPNPPADATGTVEAPTYLSSLNTSLTTNIDSLKKSADTQVAVLQDNFNKEYTKGLDYIKRVEMLARQQYRKAGGVVNSTGEEAYVANAIEPYQSRLDDLQAQFNNQKLALEDNLQNSIQTLRLQYDEKIAAYGTQQKNNFKDYVTSLKSGDGSQPEASEIMDAIQMAIEGGKSFSQAKAEIQNALDYASRVQRKADLAEQHQYFIEQHTLRMEALTQERLDQMDPSSAKNQSKYYDNYLKSLDTQIRSRTSPGGIAEQKIGRAVNAQAILDKALQSDGTYDLSPSQYGELVIAAAGLLSSTGNPTNLQIKDVDQKTAGAAFRTLSNYVSGKTDTTASQNVIKALADIIEIEGISNEQIRNTYLHNVQSTANPYFDERMKSIADDNYIVNSYSNYKKNGQSSVPLSTYENTAFSQSQGGLPPAPQGYYRASDGLLYPNSTLNQ